MEDTEPPGTYCWRGEHYPGTAPQPVRVHAGRMGRNSEGMGFLDPGSCCDADVGLLRSPNAMARGQQGAAKDQLHCWAIKWVMQEP